MRQKQVGVFAGAVLAGCALWAPGLMAQDLAAAESPAPILNLALPDAPGESMAAAAAGQSSSVVVNGAEKTPVQKPAEEHQDPQTKRILYIFPNFRSVSSSAHLPAQTTKEKLVTAAQDSFDYSAFVVPAGLAGIDDATRSTPEFGHGGKAYGRYLWHAYTDQTIENMMVEFIVPTITHEDTRYYTLGHGGFPKRAGYAISRVFVTRTDSDKRSFNFSEVVGAGAAAGISETYYPSKERTPGDVMSKWTVNLGIDAATFMLREFWPDVNHYLFHGKSTQQAPQ